MADIFLSYNEKDRAVVRRLAHTLEAVGWSVWWDRRLPAGMTWRRLLEQELQAMRCMLVLWSSHSIQSDWVCEEATEGRLLDRLIPVRIEEVRPPAGFRELQAANLVGWDGTREFLGLRELIADIEHKIGPPKQAPPPTPTPTPAPTQRWWFAGMTLVLLATGAVYLRNGTTGPDATPAAATAEPTPPTGLPAPPATPPVLVASHPIQSTQPVATVAENRKPGLQIKPPAASNPRCAALRERQELGEALSSESLLFLQKEC